MSRETGKLRSFALAAVFPLFALSSAGAATTAQRIESVSSRYLDRPYLVSPLGEGPAGVYDQDPLYRFDGFDCTTFVETVLARSLAKDFADFERLINLIRYKDGVVSFRARNHFTDADWIANNIQAGFLRDVTRIVAGKEGIQVASAVIDKAGWYRKMGVLSLNVPGASEQDLAALLARLHSEGQDVPPETVGLPYVSLDSIFTAGGAVNQDLLDRIPSGAIGNVVRPNWDLTATLGTHMNVSHQFLVIRKGGRLLVRQATSINEKKVTDMDFIKFLRPFLQSPTIKGINFLEAVSP